MKNVSDIKKEKNLNFILPLDNKIDVAECNKKVAVIIHLHYLDRIDNYIEYIKCIPKEIDVLFTTSDKKVKEKIENTFIEKKDRRIVIEKKNRGRDISALLVAARNIILKYDYICFLHDKKEKVKKYRLETEDLVHQLWENTIGSEEYIHNVLTLLDKNPKLGLLVPPTLLSEHCTAAYGGAWENDFELTKELAEKIKLNCDIDIDKPPITIGTVFWARTLALKKLLEIEWQYEDFDEEPLRGDGTISHAVERIFAYVAQDAGYETGWIMSDQYAGRRLEYIQDIMTEAFSVLKNELGVRNIAELISFADRKKRLSEFVKEYRCIYIYGAGKIAKKCLAMIKHENLMPEAFIVSDITHNPDMIQGISVIQFDKAELNNDCGIVIALGEMYREEIFQFLINNMIKPHQIYTYITE